MGNTEGGFQEMLRGYDAAATQDARAQYTQGRQQLEGAKFDFQRQKEAFAESEKMSDADRKVQQFQQRFEQAQTNGEALDKVRNATIERLKAETAANLAAQALKEQHTANVATAATNTFTGLAALDNKAADYPQQVYKLLANNPEASNHPAVMQAVQHELENYEKRTALNTKAAALTNPTFALQDALASSSPLYGVMDGKTFTPTAAGQGDQTHVQTTYVAPGGKLQTQVFPRSDFDGMVSASQARAAQGSAADSEPDGLTPTQLQSGNAQATASAPTVVAPPAVAADSPSGQHPFEGQRKFQMSTGKWGTITNGQFVPE